MSVLEQNLGGAADYELAKICESEGRIFLTFDTDFANIRAYPPRAHAGLVVFRLLSQEKKYFLSVLKKLVPVLEAASPKQQLWIVEEDRIRIRE